MAGKSSPPNAPVSYYRHNPGEDNTHAHMEGQVMDYEVVVAITDNGIAIEAVSVGYGVSNIMKLACDYNCVTKKAKGSTTLSQPTSFRPLAHDTYTLPRIFLQ